MAAVTMKILFVTYSHNILGGIEVWLDTLATHLTAKGWQATIALARGSRFNDPERFRRQWPGHRYVEIDGRTGTNEGRMLAVTRVIERLEPNVVVAVSLAHALAATGRLKLNRFPVKLVMPIHATSWQAFEEALSFSSVLDRCIGVNPLHAEWLARSGFPKSQLGTVINGARTFQVARRQERAASEPIRLLFVGRIHDESKRVFDLPAIATELRARGIPFRLTVAGDGPDADQLRQRLNAEFLGWVEQAELQLDVLPRHDIILITSPLLGEAGPPLVALEALAAGTVPVISDFIGVRAPGSIRDRETALLFECGNTTQAARRIEELYSDPALWQRLSDAGRETAREFSLDHSLECWNEQLTEVAEQPPLMPMEGTFPLAKVEPSGRLDRGGLPPTVTDFLRRTLRRYPSFPNGWEEWPGTIAPPTQPTTEQLAQLKLLDHQIAESRQNSSVLARSILRPEGNSD